MKKAHWSILISPLFILSVGILLLNDWYLKAEWNNWLTGKLSDVFGLLAFALFWMVFFPKRRRQVLLFVALGFIWWKSSLSQGAIDTWNSVAPYQISRVIDYSDLIALIVLLPLIWKVRGTNQPPRFSHAMSFVVAAFAFGATSAPEVEYNYVETYHFTFSASELIDRLNGIRNDSLVSELPISKHLQYANYYEFGAAGDSIPYHISGYTIEYDTIHDVNGNVISTYETRIPNKDTLYVNRRGVVYLEFPPEVHLDSNYRGCGASEARTVLRGTSQSSSITLKKIYPRSCELYTASDPQGKAEAKNLKNAFEKEVIDRIR